MVHVALGSLAAIRNKNRIQRVKVMLSVLRIAPRRTRKSASLRLRLGKAVKPGWMRRLLNLNRETPRNSQGKSDLRATRTHRTSGTKQNPPTKRKQLKTDNLQTRRTKFPLRKRTWKRPNLLKERKSESEETIPRLEDQSE
jgi:hypothetical protein